MDGPDSILGYLVGLLPEQQEQYRAVRNWLIITRSKIENGEKPSLQDIPNSGQLARKSMEELELAKSAISEFRGTLDTIESKEETKLLYGPREEDEIAEIDEEIEELKREAERDKEAAISKIENAVGQLDWALDVAKAIRSLLIMAVLVIALIFAAITLGRI